MSEIQVVAVVSEKGGVGKTNLVLTLAVAAVHAGRKVAVFDLDPQATAANWTDRHDGDFPWVLATPSTRLDAALVNAKGQGVDFVVIDTPPHSGAVAVEAARRADLVLIPVEPHVFSLETIPKLGVFKQTTQKSHRFSQTPIFLHQPILYPSWASDRRI